MDKIKIKGFKINNQEILVDGYVTALSKKDNDIIAVLELTEGSKLILETNKLIQCVQKVAISYDDYEKFGCPYCGTTIHRTTSSGYGTTNLICGGDDCGKDFAVVYDDFVTASSYSQNFVDESYKVIVEKHPRFGILKTPYKAPDIRPESSPYDYFYSRGVGYDLAGFVKSKEAGERIIALVQKVLKKEETKSWLDFRKHEPKHIQVKLSPEEFNLEKIHEMVSENDILTYEILEVCKL